MILIRISTAGRESLWRDHPDCPHGEGQIEFVWCDRSADEHRPPWDDCDGVDCTAEAVGTLTHLPAIYELARPALTIIDTESNDDESRDWREAWLDGHWEGFALAHRVLKSMHPGVHGSGGCGCAACVTIGVILRYYAPEVAMRPRESTFPGSGSDVRPHAGLFGPPPPVEW